jgi:hypothetical protein
MGQVLLLEIDRLLVSIEAGRGAVVDVCCRYWPSGSGVTSLRLTHPLSGPQVEQVNQQSAVSAFNTTREECPTITRCCSEKKSALGVGIVGFGLVTALGIAGTVAGHGRKCIARSTLKPDDLCPASLFSKPEGNLSYLAFESLALKSRFTAGAWHKNVWAAIILSDVSRKCWAAAVVCFHMKADTFHLYDLT